MNFEDLNKYRAIKAWNTGDNIRLDLFIAMALMIVIWFPIEYNDAQATNEGGKGLKVVLTINTNLIDQPVAIDTYQFDEFVVGYDSYMNNGATEHELNYLKGEIVNGEFMICVNAVDTGLEQCAWGYDGPEKKPEYVTVDLYSNGTPQPLNNGNSQSQSQSSSNNNENENNNVQSQSQETTIIICNDGKCKP